MFLISGEHRETIFRQKEALLILGHRAMSRDPNIYEDEDTFKPERFLACHPSCNADKPGFRSTRVFGHGRRICPGRHLGESMVFIQIATIVAAFCISAPRNSDGKNTVDYKFDFVDGLIVYVGGT